MTSQEWIEQFARELGIEPPTPEQFGAILRIASVAAHGSERTAAPVACWLAGTTGRPLHELEVAAKQVPGEQS